MLKNRQIAEAVRDRLGIVLPNAMQQAAWACPARRMVIISPTGSGKTVAFGGVLLKYLGRPGRGVRAIVMAPSRELVLQIAEVIRRLAAPCKTAALYGKHSVQDEVNSLSGDPDILVATPGRLLDHLQRGSFVPARPLTALVIDEYDKCLELGFHDQMSRIARRLGTPDVTVLTSATELDTMPEFIDMAGAETIVNEEAQPRRRLDIARVVSPSRDKLDTLTALLRALPAGGRDIVFVNHREAAERVVGHLRRAHIPAALYHGGLEQVDRERAVIMFNNGSAPVMVATDLGARGLDIDSVRSVIHYHLPGTEAAWTHRNGRTARVQADGRVFVIIAEGEDVPQYVDYEHDYVPSEPAVDDAAIRGTMVTLYIDAGKREKISKGDIVGFLTKTAGLAAADIGLIDVRDHSAYVAVTRPALPLIHALQAPRIKNRRIRISALHNE